MERFVGIYNLIFLLDRTVKLWDLEKGMETATLANHPNHVQCVRLHSAGHMLFSVSGGIVKVWDLRSLDCVKTLR